MSLAPLALALVASPASADPPRVHLDAEVDPTAYALKGYSLHAGLGLDHLRLDLGVFAMKLPAFAVGNDAYDVRFAGFGAKLQYFFSLGPDEEPVGAFVGVDGGIIRMRAELKDGGAFDTQTQGSIGIDGGYRFAIVSGLYVTPWLGIGRVIGARDVTIAGAPTYEPSKLTIFPAVHVGWRFL